MQLLHTLCVSVLFAAATLGAVHHNAQPVLPNIAAPVPKYVWSPSFANSGWHPNGPLLLGKGFGSKIYFELSKLWDEVQSDNIFTDEQRECAKELADVLQRSDPGTEDEEWLSTCVAAVYHRMIPMFRSNDEKEMDVVHRASVGGKTRCNCDLALLHGCKIHAVKEVKMYGTQTMFPEAEATAYGPYVTPAKPWLPVLVLSREHLQIGVGDGTIMPKWIYSEIFSYRAISNFQASNSEDVEILLKFVKFFVKAALLHERYIFTETASDILDANRDNLLQDVVTLGRRVLYGERNAKVLKFYPSNEAAQDALSRQNTIFSVLGQTMNAKVCRGYGKNPVGAVLDDYIEGTSVVTSEHLKSLTRAVKLLRANGLVHGDLREPNIIFLPDGRVALIDCDWSGQYGQTLFPSRVNDFAFGEHARCKIIANTRIREDFDCYCLADILARYSCSSDTVQSAKKKMLDLVLEGLDKSPPPNCQRIPPTIIFAPLGLNRHYDVFYNCVDTGNFKTAKHGAKRRLVGQRQAPWKSRQPTMMIESHWCTQ